MVVAAPATDKNLFAIGAPGPGGGAAPAVGDVGVGGDAVIVPGVEAANAIGVIGEAKDLAVGSPLDAAAIVGPANAAKNVDAVDATSKFDVPDL